MGSAENFSTQGTVRAAAIAMIILTTISFFGRFCGRLSSKQPRLQPEDVFISIAYIFFLGMCICYLVIVRKMYKISAVEVGSMAPYEGIIEDVHITVPVMLATTELLWAILWAVKFSFLFLYRKLMIRLPHYIRWWWAVFVFCLLSWIVAVVSNFVSCENMYHWNSSNGLCSTPHDIRMQEWSLYYGFAVDVLCDIMIMILPIRLVWNLHMRLWDKVGVVATISVGTLCIITSVVRVASVGSKARTGPSTTWLALWGMIEGGIAIIAACIPEFAIVLRRTTSLTRKSSSYECQSYAPQEGTLRSNHRSAPTTCVDQADDEGEDERLHKPETIAVVRTTNVDYEMRKMF